MHAPTHCPVAGFGAYGQSHTHVDRAGMSKVQNPFSKRAVCKVVCPGGAFGMEAKTHKHGPATSHQQPGHHQALGVLQHAGCIPMRSLMLDDEGGGTS